MIKNNFIQRDFSREFIFTYSRSSGPGGQNINKVNTRVELRFNVPDSTLLTENEKSLILSKLKSSLTVKGELIISSQTERSQLRNKEETIRKFNFLIREALKPLNIRKPTKPTRLSKMKNREKKILHSLKKQLRRKPDY
ncbi:MAG: aminoacyl-tRNA hydrolase [Bacteroidales bacterium]|nr:aminoacyl-tRNA hydrolase [Bacteroidales bacterium]